MLSAEVSVGLFRGDDLDPTDLNPRLLKATNHLRKSLFDFPLGFSCVDLQGPREILALLLETHDDGS